ncbi:MAG: UvrD-helicase domain-containing protein, partial [Gammaproteobacteria bacterium]
MSVLDPLTFPLDGTRIIEASAGTGKTYTISSLYLRLLLGDAAPVEDLTADRILVVTFTDAATQELRERIRERVLDLRRAVLTGEYADDFTEGLLAKVADKPDTLECLQLALQQMDEAAICTIHAFCYRMLREHAFESGSLFDYDYRIDDVSYRRRATTDFWRRLVYPMTGEELALVTSLWPTPEALWRVIAPYLMKPDLELRGAVDEPLSSQAGHLGHAVERVKWCWRSDKVRSSIENSGMRKAKDRPGGPAMLARMDEWVRGEHLLRIPGESGGLENFDELLAHYSTDRLFARSNLTQRGGPPDCEHFCGLVDVALASFRRFHATILDAAIREVSEAAIAAKLDDRLLAPDDLLMRMDAALGGPRGRTLAASARRRFPIAMVDEFQDTDPLQYRIFQRIYEGAKDCGHYMIGDPKQAIYGFRGADIFTYIDAREAIVERDRFKLVTNHRASPALVDAINGFFQSNPDPFLFEEISFDAA